MLCTFSGNEEIQSSRETRLSARDSHLSTDRKAAWFARVETEDSLARHIDLYTRDVEELRREFTAFEECFWRLRL